MQKAPHFATSPRRVRILKPAGVIASSTAKVICILCLSLIARSQTTERILPLLVHADQVRQLKPEQAELGYPVRVRGVVTNDVPSPDFFVQDSSAGVFVEGSKSGSFTHHVGDLIEVEGITGA